MRKAEFSVRRGPIDLARSPRRAAALRGAGARLRGHALDGRRRCGARHGDADRTLQVVSNLVENALRLTPAGGSVRIVAAPGSIGSRTPVPASSRGAGAGLRALLPLLPLRPRAARRLGSRARDREGAGRGHGRFGGGGEHARRADRLHGAAAACGRRRGNPLAHPRLTRFTPVLRSANCRLTAPGEDATVSFATRRISQMKNARYMLGALAALATLAFATTALAAVVIKGTKHDDVLTGTDRNDMIVGRQGNDTINGLAGNDRLHGNQDNDAIDAGPGDDRAWGRLRQRLPRRRRRERHPSRSPRRRHARRWPRQRPPLARPWHRQAAGRRRGRRPPLAGPRQAGRHDRLRPRQRRPLDQRQGDDDRHLGQLRDRQERDRPRRRRRLLVPLSPQGRLRPEAVMPPAVSAVLKGRAEPAASRFGRPKGRFADSPT